MKWFFKTSVIPTEFNYRRSNTWGWLVSTTFCSALLFGLAGTAVSQVAKDLAQDPLVERRLVAISSELRCLVCQNESLAASNADLALDLKREIRTLINNNQSDQQILDFLVLRYGDFVLYKPPFKPLTWFLWIGPGFMVVFGILVLMRQTRSTRKNSDLLVHAAVTLSADDIAKANRLLGITSNDDART